MAGRTELLQELWAASCSRLEQILMEMTDDEFFWEPCAGCWTVHRRTETRAESADGCGEWVIDYVLPEPKPAPVTTIAWRTVHVAACNHLYWDYAFGPATASFDLEMPGNASDAVDWLTASQRPLTEALGTVTDEGLDDLRLTSWGERIPARRVFTILINEQVHHGAEISLLRDLYRNRETLAGVPQVPRAPRA
ncbi:MAG: DinB family protein [Actinomycetes bacterium]